MRWFLQVLGLEVTVIGRVGHDVILAAPLPKVLPPPAPSSPTPVALLELLSKADVVLGHTFRWRPPLDARGRPWRN